MESNNEEEETFVDQELWNNEIEEFEENHNILNDRIEVFNQQFYNSTWFKERPEIIKEAYRNYPLSKFYKLKSCNKPVRIYAFSEENSESRLITAVTLVPSVNEPYVELKNYMLSSFEKLDKWEDDDLDLIKMYTQDNEKLHFIMRHPFGYEKIYPSDY
jgi:hypothetical protein